MPAVIRGLYLMIFCQVVLESLPISSSGHLILLEKVLKAFGTTPTVADLPGFFDHFLHGPTILVLLFFFYKDWVGPFRFLLKNFSFDFNSWSASYKKLWSIFLKITFFVFVSAFITTLSYFGFEFLKHSGTTIIVGVFQNEFAMLIGFMFTTSLLFSLYFLPRALRQASADAKAMADKQCDRSKDFCGDGLTIKKVLILSVVQSISFLPGISRFGSTYVVARWLGVSVRRAFQFTFLMQFPLIVIAFFDSSLKLLFEKQNLMGLFNLKVVIAFFVATILAYGALYISYTLARRRKLWYLGFYMLLPLSLLIYFIIF